MHSSPYLCFVVAAGLVVALGVAESKAQYTNDPFFEAPLRQSQAYGLEMVGQRLRITEAFAPPVNEDLRTQLRRMVGKDLARFHGTLTERNPALAAELLAALQDVMAALDDGQDASAQVAKARDLLAQSYDVLIAPAVQADPVFKGAVLANLLVANDGVAEAYEDAVHELWGFPNGWGALQRIKVLWGEIAPMATDARREEAEDLIEGMDELYHSPQPPDPFDAEKAEDAEGLAHLMVGIIEEAVDANLYTGRDMGRLATQLSEVVGSSCEAYAAGRDAVGTEGIYAVLDPYRVNFSGALDLMAPQISEEGGRLFPRLVETEWDFKVVADDRAPSPADDCRGLQQMFLDARTALGG